jgi:hypothetical protein
MPQGGSADRLIDRSVLRWIAGTIIGVVFVYIVFVKMPDSARRIHVDVLGTHRNSLGMKMVQLSLRYYVSEYETTQQQYQEIMNCNPSLNLGASLPVDHLAWNEAVEFCARLTDRDRLAGMLPENFVYALPTRTQWLDFLYDASTRDAVARQQHCGKPVDAPLPVGSGDKNSLGLYDLWGNVSEWTKDAYYPQYYDGGHVAVGSDFNETNEEYLDRRNLAGGTSRWVRYLGTGFRCILEATAPNEAIGSGDTPLHVAAAAGDTKVIASLLKSGTSSNVANRFQQTPLHRAVLWNRFDAAQQLLEAAANVDAQDYAGWTALALACRSNNEAMCRLLLDRRADVNRANAFGETPLLVLAGQAEGSAAVAGVLLDRGTEINAQDDFKWTALHRAARIGNLPIVEVLLRHGADPNREGFGWTAIECAESRNHREIVERLKQAAATRPVLPTPSGK